MTGDRPAATTGDRPAATTGDRPAAATGGTKVRVLHVGLGPIGAAAARLVAARPGWLEPVAAVDTAPNLVGRPLAEVAGIPEPTGGVAAIRVRGGIPAAEPGVAAVAVHATSSSIERCEPQLLELISAGWNVVSSCEELSYPWLAHPDAARRIDDAARAAGVAVVGTGVNPGYAMDLLPVALTATARRVDRVRVARVVDAGTRRIPLQRKVGAGLTVEEFAGRVDAGLVRHIGLRESVDAICAALGMSGTEVAQTIEPVLATRPLSSGIGPIEPGLVAGVHQTATARVGDREVVHLDLRMAVGLDDPHDEVVIEGDPDIRVLVPGGFPGDTATEAMLVNTIGPLLGAAPGLRVMVGLVPPRPAPGVPDPRPARSAAVSRPGPPPARTGR